MAPVDPAIARGREALARADVAARAIARYDRRSILRIVEAVADAAERSAEPLARSAVAETGFGVVEDKVTKNLAIARTFVSEYGGEDYCAHRVDAATGLLLVPKPAGVILAVTPSTSPVAATFFKVLSALLTRNAVVVSPHPVAAETCVQAVEVLADAARSAGAPPDAVQVVRKPTIPLIEAMMGDPITKLVLATGGGPVVKAAYRSGTPAIGVGPGNPPALVDETADPVAAARCIVDSKAFDNSVLCTAESVLFAVEAVAADLLAELTRNGAHLCGAADARRVRGYAYPSGRLNTDIVGRSAVDIARAAGVRVPGGTRLLVVPIDRVTEDEPLTHEKLSPILALRTVPDFAQAVAESRALLEVAGIGHSASIHTADPQRVLDLAAALPVHRITVNAVASLGNAGIGTSLPMTMSVGTGYVGGSSSAENLGPAHLVQWSRTAYATSGARPLPDFAALRPRDLGSPSGAHGRAGGQALVDLGREDVRRIVLEELRDLIGAR